MAGASSSRGKKLSGSASHIDTPQPGDRVCDECISIAGWFYAKQQQSRAFRIRAWIDEELVGETELRYVRPDVCATLSLPSDTTTGFRILGRTTLPRDVARTAEMVVTVSAPDSTDEFEIGRRAVELLPASLAQHPYGDVVSPEQTRVLHRENIYGSGPPVEEPGAETLQLIEQYLAPRSSILDVGCGSGAYGRALLARGFEWVGLETNATCCEMLAQRNLPFRATNESDGAFPVRDGEFESAMCIEVLEHINDTDPFLRELKRAIRHRALFSVPNIEVLPYMSRWQVVPWHMLEADHKNFFTRASLRTLLRNHFAHVEVFSYAQHPLRTADGAPLHIHLFAVADK